MHDAHIPVHESLMEDSQKFRGSRRSNRRSSRSSPVTDTVTDSDEDSSLSSTGPLSPHSEDSDTNSTTSSNARGYDGVPEIDHLESINEEDSQGMLVVKPDSEHLAPVQLSRWQSSEVQPIWSGREEQQVDETYFSGTYRDSNSSEIWPETEQCGSLPDFTDTECFSPTVVSDNFDDRGSVRSNSFSTALGSSSNHSSMDSMDQFNSPSPSFLDFNCSDGFEFDPYRVDTMAMGQGMEAAISNSLGRAVTDSPEASSRRTSSRRKHSQDEAEEDEDEEESINNKSKSKNKNGTEAKARGRVSKTIKSSKSKKSKGSTPKGRGGSKARKDNSKSSGSASNEEDVDPPTLTITDEQRKMLEEMGESSDEELIPGQPRRIGVYTVDERKQRINRFLEKRKRRCWEKKVIRYQSRKRQATKRPRVNGRFVRTDELEDYYRQHPEERPLPMEGCEGDDKEERLMINTSQLGIPTPEVMTPPESPHLAKSTVSPNGQPNASGLKANPTQSMNKMKHQDEQYITIPQVMRSVSNDSTDVEGRGRSGSDSSQSSDSGWRTIPQGAVASTSLQDMDGEPLVYRSMGGVDIGLAAQVVSQQPRPLLQVSTAKIVVSDTQPLTPTTKLARHMSKSLSMEEELPTSVVHSGKTASKQQQDLAEEGSDGGSDGAMDMDDESEPMHQVMKRCLNENDRNREEKAPMLNYGVTHSALRIACCTNVVGDDDDALHLTYQQRSTATEQRIGNAQAKDGAREGVCSSLWNSVVGSICKS